MYNLIISIHVKFIKLLHVTFFINQLFIKKNYEYINKIATHIVPALSHAFGKSQSSE